MLEMILEFALVLALAGFFVMWAKWEEQKVKTKEERDRRWDEISLRLNVEKEKDAEIAELNEWLRSFDKRGDVWYETAEKVTNERDALQDRLSALLCPRNDHVWQNGCCVKCGMVQE